jgi:hypothetical protein
VSLGTLARERGTTRLEADIVRRIDFSQSFIQHAYIELHMPSDPAKPGGFKMDPNHLHIWPRHSFMLIGLPNTASRLYLLTLPSDRIGSDMT